MNREGYKYKLAHYADIFYKCHNFKFLGSFTLAKAKTLKQQNTNL